MGSGHSTTLSRQLLGQQNVLATPFRHWGLKFCCNFLSSSLQFLYSIHRAFCRPSDHSVVRHQAEIQTRDGWIDSSSDTDLYKTTTSPYSSCHWSPNMLLRCRYREDKNCRMPSTIVTEKIRQIGFYILVGLSFWLTLVVPTNHNPSLCLPCVAK